MGNHRDQDSLALIDSLANKGLNLGYCVEKECPIANKDCTIDLVWKLKQAHDPLITFEIETSNRSGIFSNTLKIFGTKASLVRKPYWHFAIIHKAELTRGQKNELSLIFEFNNISLYENIFTDQKKRTDLFYNLDHLITNPRTGDDSIVTFIKTRTLIDSGILRSALSRYGDNLPYLLNDEFIPRDTTHSYFEIPAWLDYLNSRLPSIHHANDIKEPDFETFMKITMMAQRLDAKENLFVHNKVCPKCGNRITERQVSERCFEDQMPSSITYIIGCESCGYVINEETIDL